MGKRGPNIQREKKGKGSDMKNSGDHDVTSKKVKKR